MLRNGWFRNKNNSKTRNLLKYATNLIIDYLFQIIVKCSVNRRFRIEMGTQIIARNEGETPDAVDE